MTLTQDGLQVRLTAEEGKDAIARLRVKGYKFGNGSVGRGLYSKNWDRQLGEWYPCFCKPRHGEEDFMLNPSILHELGIDIAQLKIETIETKRHRY